MPAKDIYHDTVKRALIKDGWTITHDPLKLDWGDTDLYVDLGTERIVAAEKGEHRIAVEIKSFVSASQIHDLEEALGQYVLYHDILSEVEPQRSLYLAVPEKILREVFDKAVGRLMLKNNRAQLVVFDPRKEVIVTWIP